MCIRDRLMDCTEAHAAWLTAGLRARGAITQDAVNTTTIDRLRLGLRKTLVGGTQPSPFFTMLAIWARAADSRGGVFLDTCLNSTIRSSAPVVARLGRLDDMENMAEWWVVKARVGMEISPMSDSPPGITPEDQKPCCALQ
eukprot:TRINITY_DN18983_c0_g1_i2.p1 TRINITY_DN18983_c0_g1~~TRINITY_DN18983_c0_g1_i2.p1  ORF type:complete len:141 (+),score=33.37 TRINITY_DN18983_c0_g1_i2:137-559(+)